MIYFNGIPEIEKAYERTIRQIATHPMSEEAKVAIELLRKRTKAKRRKEKIQEIWNTIK